MRSLFIILAASQVSEARCEDLCHPQALYTHKEGDCVCVDPEGKLFLAEEKPAHK